MTSHTRPARPSIPDGLLAFLQDYDTYYLVTHTEPDGDCLASSLALGSFLERVLGKTVHHLNEGPFERREIIRYQRYFRPTLDPADRAVAKNPAAVILDCTGPDRVGKLADQIDGLPTAVIDHHASGAPYGDVRLVDPSQAATCYLIQLTIEAIAQQIGVPPSETLTSDEAYLLFFGIATDTGFFRHLEANSAALFAAVSRLMARNVSPKEIHAHMTGGKTLASRQLLATLLGRAKPFAGQQGLITYETISDIQEYGKVSRDSDPLYQLMFSIEGIRAAAVIREENETSCTGSLRSIDSIDVSRIAQLFGGGGHKRAAGFACDKPYRDVLEQVVEEFEAAFRADQSQRCNKL
ncbi:MAG: DHH family phosphoesterase [Spirochaetales bacterium]